MFHVLVSNTYSTSDFCRSYYNETGGHRETIYIED